MKSDRGFSRVELLVSVALGALLGTLASGGTLRARIAANEASAIADSAAVISANVAYAAANGGCYATEMVLLSTPAVDLGIQPFLDPQVARMTPYSKDGYVRKYAANPGDDGGPCCRVNGVPCGDPGAVTYNYVANPMTWGATGTRAFSADHTGLICEALGTNGNWAANQAGTTPRCGTNGSAPITE